jgi:outer membrane protein
MIRSVPTLLVAAALLAPARSLRAQAPPPANAAPLPWSDAPAWTLRQCTDYALEHSLDVRLGEIGMEQAEVDLRRSRMAQLPTFSANANYGLGFGRITTPDNNTISVNQTTQSTSFSVNGGMTLYGGGAIRHGIRQGQTAAELSRLDREAAEDNVRLTVLQAYLGVLLAQEDYRRVEAQIAVSRDNLANSAKLAEAGVIPEGNLRDLEAQVASDELALVSARNGVTLAYLGLRLALQADEGTAFRVEAPSPEAMTRYLMVEDWDAEMIYRYASAQLPAFAGNALAEEAARLGVSIARAGFFPTLGLGGGANTSWFTISGEAGDFLPGFGDQLDRNLGENVGINLSIPLFSAGANRAAVRSAELGVERTRVANAQELNALRQTIQQAVADAEASAGSYRAAQKVVDARRLAAEFAQRRFEAGQGNAFELNQARTLLQQAEADLLRAKYNFLLTRKVLDFYRGQPIEF